MYCYILPLFGAVLLALLHSATNPASITAQFRLQPGQPAFERYGKRRQACLIAASAMLLPGAAAAFFPVVPLSCLALYLMLWAVAVLWMYRQAVNSLFAPDGVFRIKPAARVMLLLIFALMGAATANLFYLDYSPTVVSRDARGGITIKSPLHTTAFHEDEIRSITRTNALPRLEKVRGGLSGTRAVGLFRADTGEIIELHAYSHNPPFLAIRTKDKTLIVNGKTGIETTAILNRITAGSGG